MPRRQTVWGVKAAAVRSSVETTYCQRPTPPFVLSALISSAVAEMEHVVVISTDEFDSDVLVTSSKARVSLLFFPPNLVSDFASASALAPQPKNVKPHLALI